VTAVQAFCGRRNQEEKKRKSNRAKYKTLERTSLVRLLRLPQWTDKTLEGERQELRKKAKEEISKVVTAT